MTTMTAEIEIQEPFTWALSYGEYLATVEKIAKINDRAVKRGFTGRLAVEGTREERTVRNQFTGITSTEVIYRTRITGDAPAYGGWKFLARIDRVGDSFTIASAPGVDHVERSLVHAGECDHCGFNRRRNNTYLVVNEATGETVNVGSTCLKDFLGWDASVVFFTESDLGMEESLGGGFGGGEREYSVKSVVAAAYAATRAHGWVRSGDWNARPTADWTRLALGMFRPSKADEDGLRAMAAFAADADERAEEILAFIASDAFAGKSTYVENLKVVAEAGVAGSKQIGLLASAPQAYARYLETKIEREAREAQWAAEKASNKASEYFGQVKERLTVEGTVTGIRYIEGQYGTTTLYTILTSEGNIAKWFSSNGALGDTEGVAVKILATVKGHEEYNGVKQTMLTRCKAL